MAAKCCLKLGDWYDTLPQPTIDVQQRNIPTLSISQNTAVLITVPPLLLAGTHGQIPAPPILAPSPHVIQPVPPNPPQPPILTQAMKFYSNATNYDPNWYKAWHKLASAYFNAAVYQSHNTVGLAFC